MELSTADAEARGVHEGDVVRVSTPRGQVERPVRISGIRPGKLFVPFHYGYRDSASGHQPDAVATAANELTITDWDPASKQPIFKTAKTRLTLLRKGEGPSPAPTTTRCRPAVEGVPPTRGGANAEVEESLTTEGAR